MYNTKWCHQILPNCLMNGFFSSPSHLLDPVSIPQENLVPLVFCEVIPPASPLPMPCLLFSSALRMVTSPECTPGLFPPALATFTGEAWAHLILCWRMSSPCSVPAPPRAAGLASSLSEEPPSNVCRPLRPSGFPCWQLAFPAQSVFCFSQ